MSIWLIFLYTACLFLLSSCPVQSAGQPVGLDEQERTARELYQQGRVDECEKLLQKNIQEASSADTYKRQLANALEDLAVLYMRDTRGNKAGNYSEAESLLERALRIREQSFGTAYPATQSTRRRLSQVYELQGNYKRAAELLKVDVELKKLTLGEQHPAVAAAILDLARVYAKESPSGKSQALSMQEQLLQPAGTYEKELDQTITHGSKPDRTNGGLQLAEKASKLAKIYEEQGRLAEAEPLEKRILQIYRQLLPEDDALVFETALRLANVYRKEGDAYIKAGYKAGGGTGDSGHEQAYEKYRQATLVCKSIMPAAEKKYGKDAPGMIPLLALYGDALKGMRAMKEATAVFMRYLSIAQKNHHLEGEYGALEQLAYLYEEQWLLDDSEATLQKMLVLEEKFPEGERKHKLMETLVTAQGFYRNHGVTRHDHRRFELSEQCFARLLALQKEVYGPTSKEVMNTTKEIAVFHLDRQKFDPGYAGAGNKVR
jgi:hypothetical protein